MSDDIPNRPQIKLEIPKPTLLELPEIVMKHTECLEEIRANQNDILQALHGLLTRENESLKQQVKEAEENPWPPSSWSQADRDKLKRMMEETE